jgi:hypothetical protein
MDDLFEGYMDMDALADFLLDNPPTNKRPEVVPHSQKSMRPSDDSTRSSISCTNGHSQWYATSGTIVRLVLMDISNAVARSDTAAPGSSRQRRGHTKSRLGCIACKRRKVKVRSQNLGV